MPDDTGTPRKISLMQNLNIFPAIAIAIAIGIQFITLQYTTDIRLSTLISTIFVVLPASAMYQSTVVYCTEPYFPLVVTINAVCSCGAYRNALARHSLTNDHELINLLLVQ